MKMKGPEEKPGRFRRFVARGIASAGSESARQAWLLAAAYGTCFLLLSCFLLIYIVSEKGGAASPGVVVPGWSAPAADAWFGRDEAGGRLLEKTFAALAVSAWAALISSAAGTALGMALIGGTARILAIRGCGGVRRLIDTGLRFPALFLLLVFSAGFGTGFWKTVLAMTLLVAVFVMACGCRWLAGLQGRGDVLAARAMGVRRPRLVREHNLHRVWRKMVALAAVLLPAVLVAESALSFAGFGLGAGVPNAGRLIFEGREAMFEAPWLLFFPGLALWVLAMVFGALAAVVKRLTGETVSERLM